MNMNVYELLTTASFGNNKTFGTVYINGQPYDHDDLLDTFGTERDFMDTWGDANSIFKDNNHGNYPDDYGYENEDDNFVAQAMEMDEDFSDLYDLMLSQVDYFGVTADGDMDITTINGVVGNYE